MAYSYKGTRRNVEDDTYTSVGYLDDDFEYDNQQYGCGDAIGTDAGYQRHRRMGEDPCRKCTDAHTKRTQVYRPLKRQPIVCGTKRGFDRHMRNKESACQPCRNARQQYLREKRTA